MNHIVAIFGFAVFCSALFLVQRWAGSDGEAPPCDRCEQPGCAKREPEDL